jgi:hypothetical protein
VLNSRLARKALVVLGALVGLSPSLPAASLPAIAATVPLTASVSSPAPMDANDLAAYRRALLDKQSSAIGIRNAIIKALHDQKVQELGYEPSVTDPREIARQMMLNKYGWDDAEYTCYDLIIMRESRWNPYADNPHSTAYGIPQALPGSRMAKFGPDWRTNPATQIRWGLDYVDTRYGTPCRAWSFKRSHGWY